MVEQWRAECLTADAPGPNDFPEMKWKVMVQAFAFFGLTGTASLEHSFIKETNNALALLIIFVATVISVISGIFLSLDAWGVFSAQFWRATWSLFGRRSKKPDNYPFTHLKQRLEKDFDGAARLKPFPDAVLVIANNRFAADEGELRDRLTMFFGGAPIVMFVGLLATVWTSWQSFQLHFNVLTSAILSTSVLVMFFSVFGVKFRVALFELTRSRAMISLELARRKHSQASLEAIVIRPGLPVPASIRNDS